MKNINRWLCSILLILGMAWSQQALAQKVLILTSNVVGANVEKSDAIAAFDNLELEFKNKVGPTNVQRQSTLGTASSINKATFTNAGEPYDIVIVASAYAPIDDTNWAILAQAIENRWANTLLFFVDGCCDSQNGGNSPKLVKALNAGAKTDFILGSTSYGTKPFPLNTKSPFAPSFSGLNPFQGGDITYINKVPASNALYLASGTAAADFPAPGMTPVDNVYGLLVPTAQSNIGKGACVFAVVDLSPFIAGPWAPNQGKVAPAFVDAATSDTGACGLPKVSKSFDKTDMYLGGSSNSSLLSINLSNGTPVAIPNVSLTDKLPAPLVIAPGSITNTCTLGTASTPVGSDTIAFTELGIPAGGCSISVPVIWPNTDIGRKACVDTPIVTNTITPGVDFVSPTGQINGAATATLSCRAGQLNISKHVVWPANVPPTDLTGTSFPVSVACTGSDGIALSPINSAIVLSSADAGSVALTPVISEGACTVTETNRPAAPTNFIWAETLAPSVTATLSAPPAAASAQLTNTLARASSNLSINTNVLGGPAAGISGVLHYTANCGVDGSFTADVTLASTSAGTAAISNLPQGGTCTISQDITLPTPPNGYTWSTNLPAPVTLSITSSGNVAAFANTLIVTATPTPAPVPALDMLKLVLMALAIAALGIWSQRKTKRV